MNCPTCGLLNLPTAKFCIHCKSPIDSTSRAASPAGGNIIELHRLKPPSASAGGAQAQRAPVPQSDWRDQLSLKLEQIKDKNSDASGSRPDTSDEDFRQREFVRPGAVSPEPQPDSSQRRPYHPLAEKALEKIDRVKAISGEQVLEIPPEPQIPMEVEAANRRRRSARKNDKLERIEIDLSQPTLPFESTEGLVSARQDDQVQRGLAAAPLGPRAKAARIDALFVFGCFLIFLLIVFFVPEFALFTRSSLLGMGFVFLIIYLSYFGTFTALGGRTLGMDHQQLEVVSYRGGSITLQEGSLRMFGYLISLGCFGLGFLSALFDPEQLTWHDRLSKTLVVGRTSLPPHQSEII